MAGAFAILLQSLAPPALLLGLAPGTLHRGLALSLLAKSPFLFHA
jgi:hypothetical protein